MNCTEFSNLLDAYLDGGLAPEEQARVEAHAAACAECGALLTLCRDCRALDEQLQVPASFSAAWRQAVRREAEKEQKAQRKRTLRGVLTAAAALVFVAGGALMTRQNGWMHSLTAAQTPAATAAPAPVVTLATAASGAPAVNATSLPSMDISAETADAESDAGVWAKQAPAMSSLIAEAAVSNVLFGARADGAAEEAGEDAWDMAPLCEEAAEDTAELPMAAEEELAAGKQPEPAPAEAEAEILPEETEESPAEQAAREESAGQAGFLREAGGLALCALPWLALVILAWLVARRIRKRKKERK